MKSSKHIQIIATIGPSTWTEKGIRELKDKGVDFVRVNMSHSTIEDLKRTIKLAKKVGIPFIVDTEGSQVRTGSLKEKKVTFDVGDTVRVYAKSVAGDRSRINLTPDFVAGKLSPGDVLYCDFDSLVMCVSDTSTLKRHGYITLRILSGGTLGSNKGIYVDTVSGLPIEMPPLTKKDYESIRVGLKEDVGHIAASFMRSGEAVRLVRKETRGKMKIISKIECIDALNNLDDIIDESDALLVDRGDLSKEIQIYRIPFSQKIIVHRARRKGKPVIVATNFLESMIQNRLPTRAEVHDIESSITDGAAGLTLAAETAIGAHPLACVTVMRNVFKHVTSAIDLEAYAHKEDELVSYLEAQKYLQDVGNHSPLIPPHGGTLVHRYRPELLKTLRLTEMPSITLDDTQEMDVEQIGLGAYSPLEGFMGKKELNSVLDTMRLPSGIVWPLPIVLAVNAAQAQPLKVGKDVLLRDHDGVPLARMHLTEKFAFDKKEYAQKLYGTEDSAHPGVCAALALGEVFLAGTIDLLRRRTSETAPFEFSPAQTRRYFEGLGWSKVVGFHTRNVIHRAHEYIQMKAYDESGADGLFVHPVVGKKKPGDFQAPYIAASYELMTRYFYPKNKVLFAAMPTYSRYAGPKEALFTALVRQNFGCSHFIVGRDHTGVGSFYAPFASHDIFDQFPDIGITPMRFGEVAYSKRLKSHVHMPKKVSKQEHLSISGTEARAMLEKGKLLPEWFMRKEISQLLVSAIKRGKSVFVK